MPEDLALVCECGEKLDIEPEEAEAYLEAKSHFPFLTPLQCKNCQEASSNKKNRESP